MVATPGDTIRCHLAQICHNSIEVVTISSEERAKAPLQGWLGDLAKSKTKKAWVGTLVKEPVEKHPKQ